MEPRRRVGSAGGFSGWRTGIQVRALQGPGPAFSIPITTRDLQGALVSSGSPWDLSTDPRPSISSYTLPPPHRCFISSSTHISLVLSESFLLFWPKSWAAVSMYV